VMGSHVARIDREHVGDRDFGRKAQA
jgi:hypothetical protein